MVYSVTIMLTTKSLAKDESSRKDRRVWSTLFDSSRPLILAATRDKVRDHRVKSTVKASSVFIIMANSKKVVKKWSLSRIRSSELDIYDGHDDDAPCNIERWKREWYV